MALAVEREARDNVRARVLDRLHRRDLLERPVAWVGAGVVLLAVVLGLAVWLADDPETEVEALEKRRRVWVDVALFRAPRARRVQILEGECRVHEADRRLGAFDVQQVDRVGLTLRLCPFTDEEANEGHCERRQRFELVCRSPALVQSRRDRRRVGRRLWLEVRGEGISVVAYVDIERYVDSVVRSEHPRAPFEAQRVQAIVTRTFALHALNDPRHHEASLCDSPHCQVYRGALPEIAGPTGAHSTAGAYLIDSNGEVAPSFFHSTCGGHTLDAEKVWPGTGAESIVGVPDVDDEGRDWCRDSRYHRWSHRVLDDDLARALSKAVGRTLDAKTLTLSGSQRGQSWRIGDKNGTSRVKGAKVHRVLGRTIGWDHVLSPRFTAKRRGGDFTLIGVGLGHGVGLCQTGAAARAEAGQSAEEILRAYFPDLELIKK